MKKINIIFRWKINEGNNIKAKELKVTQIKISSRTNIEKQLKVR